MSSYTGTADRPQRAKAIAAVVAVHAALAFIILSGLNVRIVTGTGSQSVGATDDAVAGAPPVPAATTFTLPASPRVGEQHLFKYLAASGSFTLTVSAASSLAFIFNAFS